MRETTTPPERRISCRMDGDTVLIDLSSDEEPARLYLTADEAKSLVSSLYEDLMLALWRMMEESQPPPNEIIVADISLNTKDAWQLMESLEDLLFPSPYHFGEGEVSESDDEMEQPEADDDWPLSDRVNWMAEGF